MELKIQIGNSNIWLLTIGLQWQVNNFLNNKWFLSSKTKQKLIKGNNKIAFLQNPK